MAEAPLEVTATQSFSTRLASIGPHRQRMLDRLLLSSYVPPQEWVHSLANIMAPGSESTQEIIDHWSPFNKSESLVTHMRDLYPTLLQMAVEACVEQYSISLLGYLDRETFPRMAEEGMLIHNHDFH